MKLENKKRIQISAIDICRRNYVNNKIVSKNILNEHVRELLSKNKCVKFVGYWGATNKYKLDESDLKTLNHLSEYIRIVSDICNNDCEWTFLLADMHAVKNGYSLIDIKNYLSIIKTKLETISNVHTEFVSDFWKQNDIEKRIEEYKVEIHEKWPEFSLRPLLINQAFKNDVSDRRCYDSAFFYYCMRKVESKIISEKYNEAIFFTYSTQNMQELYPKLPCCFLWSQKRGISKPPWIR